MARLLTLILLSFSISFAGSIDTADKALRLKEKISDFLFVNSQVNGVGVGACNMSGGKADFSSGEDWTHCISITASEPAYTALKTLYPEGSRYEGVFISVESGGAFYGY